MITGKLEAVESDRVTVHGETYTLEPGGRVLRGTWGNYTVHPLSDLKPGQTVQLRGVPGGTLHSVVITGEAPKEIKGKAEGKTSPAAPDVRARR